MVEPPVLTPKFFAEETQIFNFFLLNIIDKTIDKGKMKEKLENLQFPNNDIIWFED